MACIPAAFGRLCVETFPAAPRRLGCMRQPPSGGCVLKHALNQCVVNRLNQPPSGGCVLKLSFRLFASVMRRGQPPSGGCVLKPCLTWLRVVGRLAVETLGSSTWSFCSPSPFVTGACWLSVHEGIAWRKKPCRIHRVARVCMPLKAHELQSLRDLAQGLLCISFWGVCAACLQKGVVHGGSLLPVQLSSPCQKVAKGMIQRFFLLMPAPAVERSRPLAIRM